MFSLHIYTGITLTFCAVPTLIMLKMNLGNQTNDIGLPEAVLITFFHKFDLL